MFLFLLFFFALHAVDLPLYVFFTRIPDGVAKPVPFADMRDVLQAGLCWRRGVDVYVPSACLHGGVFNYSPFLLRAAYLPVGPGDAIAGGVLLAVAFILALNFLPRPETRRECLVLLAGVLSTSVYYGIEQGNFDVAIFVMTVAGLRLLAGGRAGGAYGVFLVAAAMKFYPLALFVLALRAPARRVAVLAGIGPAALVIFLVLYGPDVVAAIRVLPSGTPFRATFGRIDLPRGLNLLHVLTARGVDGWLGPVFSSGSAVAETLSWLLSAGAIAASAAGVARARAALAQLGRDQAMFLIAGAAVTVLCFYAAQNVYYRAIFLLLTLPALGRLRTHCVLLAAVLLLLWEAVFRALLAPVPALRLGFWLFRECLWWWVIIELGAFVLAFVTGEARRLDAESGLRQRLKIDEVGKKL